jgi:hypothetical protein
VLVASEDSVGVDGDVGAGTDGGVGIEGKVDRLEAHPIWKAARPARSTTLSLNAAS